MSTTYTVKQGDHLFGIAEQNGFHDYTILWNHAQNAQLKQTRQNPNILFPEDQVFIPDLELGEESRPTNQRHKFQVNTEQLKLRFMLEDIYEKPIAGAPCNLIVDGDSHTLTSDGSGKIELPIRSDAKKAVLIVDSDQTPFERVEIPIKIGHLDPIDTLSGQKGRLNNLGYFAGDVTGPADDDFESAVEEFQCDQSLTVDGKCGPATQAKLKQVHGC